ncbi:MAG: hypothetical protein PWP53_1068 [Lacrimispora sp.]|nr:hypothetical protein [Lacrimispora sp.]
MNYATIFYKLQKNPCKAVGSIGKSSANAMQIWTLDQLNSSLNTKIKLQATWLSIFCFGPEFGKVIKSALYIHTSVSSWQTYAHLYPDKEKMLASQLNTAKINGITANLSLEDQLTKFMTQFQGHIAEQPALIDISSEEIIRWNPETREKTIVTREEFEADAILSQNIEADLAVAEIFQSGYLEISGIVYCLASRGLPIKYL